MNQFKSYHRVTIHGKDGVVAVAQNVPDVNHNGDLSQSSVAGLLQWVTGNLDRTTVITDIRMEELPLEGDYKVNSPTDFFTDEGIAYALASIFDWKDPRNSHPIMYQAGEGIYTKSPVDILNLNAAFKNFDPVNDLELCMIILQIFKVELRYEERTGHAYFRGHHGEGNKFVTNEQIRREICRAAIDRRVSVISSCSWDGTVHLSMVLRPPATIADMAPGQQESVSILQDPPKPSDVFSAAALESSIRVGDASRFTGEQKD